jgi:hypothetical protein
MRIFYLALELREIGSIHMEFGAWTKHELCLKYSLKLPVTNLVAVRYFDVINCPCNGPWRPIRL